MTRDVIRDVTRDVTNIPVAVQVKLMSDVIAERHHADASAATVGIIDVELGRCAHDEIDQLLEVLLANAARRVDGEDDVGADRANCANKNGHIDLR